MRLIQATLLLLFLAAVGAFALQNNNTTDIKFLTWGVRAPISVLVVGVYLLGMISGGAVFGLIRLSLRKIAERPASSTQI